MDFLLNYGLFLAKTLTLLGGLAALLFMVALLRQKSPQGTLKAEILNDVLEDYTSLLQDMTLSEEALKTLQKENKAKLKAEKKDKTIKPTCYVLHFKGDIKASPLEALRHCVTAIVGAATTNDCVFLHLESGGGYVPHYGAAASQLIRLKDKSLKLTVSVDKIAGSGGYMMACVADKIIASHFAVLGSIGVLGEVPNFHRLLDKHDIDYEQHTSAQFKRTLTTLGKNTNEAREKFKEQLGEIHQLFKDHVAAYRPSLDLEKTATGETWYGADALKVGLIDAIQTSDDYLMNLAQTHTLVELSYELPKSLKERLTASSEGLLEGVMNQLMSKTLPRFMS